HPMYAHLTLLPRPPVPPLFPYTTLFRSLASVAAACGAKLVHVKPHGALYNQAVKNRELAEAIANGVSEAARAESDSLRKDIDSRSEEHTSELQSRFDLVCRLLLEKKKQR